jgi:hypothetical protein
VLVGLAAGLPLGLPSSSGGPSSQFATGGNVGALKIPRGANGIAVILYGRLFVTTKSGFDLRGLPVDAAALSPRAVNVAAGIDHSLVELAPSGRRVWSHPAGVQDCPAIDKACDTVSALAWSPDGSRIAYVVTTASTYVVHVIRRDGTHDTVIDRNARPVQPTWRADSRALAYVGVAGARFSTDNPIIYGFAHRSRKVIRWPIARSPATHLAFAPHGNELAIGTVRATLLVGSHDRVVRREQTMEVSWLGARLAVSSWFLPKSRPEVTQLYRVTHSGAILDRPTRLPGPILATHGRTAALRAGTSVLAGPIGSLQRVLRFTVKPCYSAEDCQLPMGDQDISLG